MNDALENLSKNLNNPKNIELIQKFEKEFEKSGLDFPSDEEIEESFKDMSESVDYENIQNYDVLDDFENHDDNGRGFG